MKLKLLILFLVISLASKAQNFCIRINCNDTIPYTATSDSLNADANFKPLTVLWKVVTGPGVIVNPSALNTVITGLKPGTVNVISCSAILSGGTTVMSNTSITVLPAPPPKTLVKVTQVFDALTGIITTTKIYSDGSQTVQIN